MSASHQGFMHPGGIEDRPHWMSGRCSADQRSDDTSLQYAVICCHSLHAFSMKVHYGELLHFCDDPVCPDPEAIK